MTLQHPMMDPKPDVTRSAAARQADPERGPAAVTALQILPALRNFWRATYALLGSVLGLTLGGLLGLAVQELLDWNWATVLVASAIPGLLLAAAGWGYAGLRFARYRGELYRDEGVRLMDGVWWRSESWLPMARLQHLDVDQGPLDRYWGMATLSLHTAGTHDHQLRLKGLALEQAHALRDALMPRAALRHD